MARPHHEPPSHHDFIDRDISLLRFNERVLDQAKDSTKPLLERVRFLSIFHSNIDEFFMKRIGRPRNSALFGTSGHNQDRMTLIRNSIYKLFISADHCFKESLLPLLKSEGISLLKWADLTRSEKDKINHIFDQQIFPVLTPLSVDPAHPFPHISNLSTSLAISLKTSYKSELSFLRVKIPKIFPAWYALNPDKKKKIQGIRFIGLHEIIRHNLHKLFANMKIEATMLFRVTRNIDLEKDQESYEDFVEMVEEELKQRKFGEVVKIEVESKVNEWLLEKLMTELELSHNDIYGLSDIVDYTNLNVIANLNFPNLKYPIWSPIAPSVIEESSNIFSVISKRDILVHHPYESFSDSVESFIHAASEDPYVRAIKITLYRIYEKSSIVPALIHAAERGKEVVCLIELTARFDEARNISWANRMEEAGIHVVYGLQGLKIHSKLALVVRQEGDNMKTYLHVGTGNYHTQTAKIYTDMGLFTSHPQVTNEVVNLFNFLTGLSQNKSYEHLLVAPINMKQKFFTLIDEEIKNAKHNKPAHIIVKCNNLEDSGIIKKLIAASAVNVKVDLIIRSICTLKPGVPGKTENIRVTSIVDRFLEHSRIFYFRSGQKEPEDGTFYIGSVDWMHRNLMGRVEVACPIYSPDLKKDIYQILQMTLKDDWQTWELQPDGEYRRLSTAQTASSSSQNKLMEYAINQNMNLQRSHNSQRSSL